MQISMTQASPELKVNDWRRMPGQGLNGVPLGQYGDDAVLYGLGGLGQAYNEQNRKLTTLHQTRAISAAVTNTGTMQAIIDANTKMQANVAKANAITLAKASRSPASKAKLLDQARVKSVPGTNVQSAIIAAMNEAAGRARAALVAKKAAADALKVGDRDKAAAATVSYLTHVRQATELANSAERTRVATAADKLAATLNAQSSYLSTMGRGNSREAMQIQSKAGQLAAQAKKLQAVAAVVAAQPDLPANIPSPQRIADLANKYNVRTAGRAAWEGDRALLSVLGEWAATGGAQATDYDAARNYYGTDVAATLMADLEYGRVAQFISGLNGIGALGQKDSGSKSTTPSDNSNMNTVNMKSPTTGASTDEGGSIFSRAWNTVKEGYTTTKDFVVDIFSDGKEAVDEGVATAKEGERLVEDIQNKTGIPAGSDTKAPTVVTNEPTNPREIEALAAARAVASSDSTVRPSYAAQGWVVFERIGTPQQGFTPLLEWYANYQKSVAAQQKEATAIAAAKSQGLTVAKIAGRGYIVMVDAPAMGRKGSGGSVGVPLLEWYANYQKQLVRKGGTGSTEKVTTADGGTGTRITPTDEGSGLTVTTKQPKPLAPAPDIAPTPAQVAPKSSNTVKAVGFTALGLGLLGLGWSMYRKSARTTRLAPATVM